MIEILAVVDMLFGGVSSCREVVGIGLDSTFQILSYGSTEYLILLTNIQTPNMWLLSFNSLNCTHHSFSFCDLHLCVSLTGLNLKASVFLV